MNSNPFEILGAELSDIKNLLLEIRDNNGHQSEAMPDPNEIGGVDFAMQLTGLAKATIYSLACRRQIPHCKKGKRIWFKRIDLQSWIEEGKRSTHKEEAANLGATKKGKCRK